MTLAPGTNLGPYEILAPIGSGGMGEVWKARDTRLGRIVAIKKVKEQHSERFKQEARSIAALNHSNICQIFDIGSDYLVLEYVEGKPLSSPLPEREVVRIGIQIATALEAAHKRGIIHRDLKPGNIMVTDEGLVKLLDFGLAKLYEQRTTSSTGSTADYPPTQAGTVLGTVSYMSPEQAQGEPVDARSDIFCFGLVLYEMLSGRRAFAGNNTPAVMAALLRDEPPPPKASPSLEKIVRRCLAKQPSGRYQTMSEVKTALEQVFFEKPIATAAEAQPSIAVLPFVNMSGDKEQEYFSDGLAEEIINALTQIPGLRVIARTSAFAFKDKREDVRRIAEALGVTNILEGSVRRAGNRIRATAQLIDASNGSRIWSERYERAMTDVFAIQDEISQAIADKLRIQLSGDRPLIKRYTENVEAYSLYLKGRHSLHRYSPEGLAKGKEYFEQAIVLDPNYALAWYGLASYYDTMGYLGYMLAKAAIAQSSQVLLKVLDLDETLPEAHAMNAVLRTRVYDWKGAELEFRRAMELGPESLEVRRNYNWYYLMCTGRLDESIAALQRDLEMDPLSPMLQWHLGYRYYLKRQWDRAIEQYHAAIELDSNYMLAHLFLGTTYFQMRRISEGQQIIEKAVQTFGRNPVTLAFLGSVYAVTGRAGEARSILGELRELAQKTNVPPNSFAVIYSRLGEIDEAFDWYEKAVDAYDGNILDFSVNFAHDSLRTHPRYHSLLRKMNLEPR